MIHDRIGAEARNGLMTADVDEVVDPLPHPPDGIEAFPLFHGLVGAGLVDFEGGFAVEPVVRSAQAKPLGRDHTDVVRRKRLAQ